ncbi:hypothetical protein ACWGJP_07080 [Microbacterium sp. NPDC055903]
MTRVTVSGARALTAACAAVCVLLVLAGSALIATRAWAEWSEVAETGQPGYLSLRSDPGTPQWSNLRPGDSRAWLIEASLADAPRASLDIELHAEGELIDAGRMTVSVTGCSEPFSDAGEPRCGGVEEIVVSEEPLAAVGAADAAVHPLLELRADAPRYLLVVIALAASASQDETAGASARIGVGLHVQGETEDEGGVLPSTGGDLGDLVPVAVLAAGMTGLGLTALLRRRFVTAREVRHG